MSKSCSSPIRRSKARRSEREVSIFEKAGLAALAQRYWSDNSVSVTLSFDTETEAQHVGTVLHMYEGQLKTVSFLPMGDDSGYEQLPYTNMSQGDFDNAGVTHRKVNLNSIYKGKGVADAEGEQFCTTDVCLMPETMPRS